MWQDCALRLSSRTIASNLSINEFTVHGILHLLGTKEAISSRKASRKRSEPVQLFVIFLRSLAYSQRLLIKSVGVNVNESAVCKFLRKAGLKSYHHMQPREMNTFV